MGIPANLTDRESAVVTALMDRDGAIYSHEIASYADIPRAEIAGVISSLVKKKIVLRGDDGTGTEYLELRGKP